MKINWQAQPEPGRFTAWIEGVTLEVQLESRGSTLYFARDGIHGNAESADARLDYKHGMWGLTPAGREEAERLGCL